MDDELHDDIYNKLNGETPKDILYEFLESDFDEVIIVAKKGDEISRGYDYQNETTALGMLELVKADILSNLEED